MSTVLISGGAGFIGSHLCDAYLALGWNVVAIDDLSTGQMANLAGAQGSQNFRFVQGDVADKALVERAMEGCEVVVHLAARIGLKLVIESPLKTLAANVRGTEVVLECATARKLLTVVTSTSEVYGLTTKFPSSESDPISFGSPEIGRWSYACSKAYDEALALASHRESGLPAIVVRLFNTVGPRQSTRYGMVLPRFVRQALAGEPLTVYGDGHQTRCFGHVHDAVDGILKLTRNPEAIGKVFNLGNPQEIRILELANKVLRQTGSEAPIECVAFDVAYGSGFEEIMRRVPDISRIRSIAGFEPSRSIDDIVRDVVAYQRTQAVTAP